MRVADLVIFIIYLTGITVFGSLFYRKNKTTSAFTLGNRNIPGWVITMSIFATFVSSISYLALPGSAYLNNWNAFVFSLSIPIAAFIAVRFFVPIYRKIDSPSAYSFLEERFGPWARIYASSTYFLTQLMRIGTILYLLALTIHSIFGWGMVTVIIITGVTIMIYSVMGGIQAVVWTDAIQGIILITGAVVCCAYLLIDIPGGVDQFIGVARQHHKFSLGNFNMKLDEPTFWVVLIYGIFINLQNYGIDQNYVQRYIASKSEREAKRAAFYGGMLYIPVSALFLFIGTALFAFYQVRSDLLPPELLDPSKSDSIFPFFIVQELPVGMTGLLIASIFAAGMSTISTSYNSTATVFLTDYYHRFFRKKANDSEALRILYISSFAVSFFGILIAIGMINVKSVLDIWWKMASVFSGGMLGLFLLGAFTKIKNTTGPIIGVVSGIGVIIWLSMSNLLPEQQEGDIKIHAYLTIVFGTTTLFLVGFLFTWMIHKIKNQANY